MILTDGAGNVSLGHISPQEEIRLLAERIASENLHSVVVNMEHAAFDQGLAQALADSLQAPCYTITDLKAENLYFTVRNEMQHASSSKFPDLKK